MINFTKFCSFKKFRNPKITKLNPCGVRDSHSPNIWSKYDTSIPILHISTYSHEIRACETYFIPIPLINNRKIDIHWKIRFLFLLKLQNWIPMKCFAMTKSRNYIPKKCFFFFNCEIKYTRNLIRSRYDPQFYYSIPKLTHLWK